MNKEVDARDWPWQKLNQFIQDQKKKGVEEICRIGLTREQIVLIHHEGYETIDTTVRHDAFNRSMIIIK